jgi:hypothetical protein
MLPDYILACPAWRTLPGDAIKLLLDVWTRHNGLNNGDIAYSVRDAEERLGMPRSVAARHFHVLVDRGFLVITRWSAFRLKTKEARLWRITAEKTDSERATKEFMQWRPPATLKAAKVPDQYKRKLPRLYLAVNIGSHPNTR